MFKKIVCVALAISAVIAMALAGGHHGGHHGGGHHISLPNIPLPVAHIDTSGLLALLKRPPIPVVHLPGVLNLHGLNLPIPEPFPVLSFPFHGDHHGHHGHHGGDHHEHAFGIVGDLINSILGPDSHHDHWSK